MSWHGAGTIGDGPDLPDEERTEPVYTDSELFAKALHDLALLAMQRAARRKHTAWLASTVACPVCRGTGHGADVWDECGCCEGTGRVPAAEAAEMREAM